MISPTNKTINVEITKPIMPLVKSAVNIDRTELIPTFEIKIAHNKRFPLFLKA
jgi:hypothetical protein